MDYNHRMTMVFRDAMDQNVKITVESHYPVVRVYDLIENLKKAAVMAIPKVEE